MNTLKGHEKKAAARVTIEAAAKRRLQPHPARVRREQIKQGLFTRMDYDPAYLDEIEEEK